jgi:hypothetical protein
MPEIYPESKLRLHCIGFNIQMKQPETFVDACKVWAFVDGILKLASGERSLCDIGNREPFWWGESYLCPAD